ncbi:MAG: Crp/Fnr family transcriptional regulator [Gammaproteobacteria bacterium]|jgi:CRP/FNR family transcriptional regulator, dissimilatory nitrate respiration regulator
MKDDTIDAELRRSYLFADLSDEQLGRVKGGMTVVRLSEGQRLFDHGQEAKRFFLVREGQIKLYRLSADGAEKVIEIVQPGESFAEAIMFMERRVYPVSADALEAAEMLAFDSKSYQELLRESVDTCFRLMGAMSMRLRTILNEINAITLQNATFRLIHFILGQLPDGKEEAPSVELGAPKNIIASRLSIQPETLSRILHNLSKKGVISVQGKTIHIHDRPYLESYLR